MKNYVVVLALTHGDQGGSIKHLRAYLAHLNSLRQNNVLVVTNIVGLKADNLNLVYVPTDLPKIGPYISIMLKLAISFLSNFLSRFVIIDFFNPIFLPSRATQVAIVRDLGEMELFKYDARRMFYRKYIMLPLCMRFAKKIISISETTKRDILKHFASAAGKVLVVHHGADLGDDSEVCAVKSDYFVCLGRLDAVGKNLINTLIAFENYCINGGRCDMLLVGSPWRNTSEIYDLIDNSTVLGKRVTITGFVSQDVKVKLLRNAKCLVFLSKHEGFGHPILEAHANGCTVLCSDIDVFREIGGDAAYFVRPDDIEEIERSYFKMEEFTYNDAAMERFRRNVERFAWEQNFASYDRILGINC